uniref:Protein FAM24A n=1 Tax=Sus scrofa TaxID=9823 RepID=A0A8D0X1H5_PIG
VCEMFDLEIMIAIGGSLLMTAFVLMAVVVCLYYKMASTSNVAKAPVARAKTSGNRDKVTEATSSTPESYPSLQCCEECGLSADFDPPLCFCDMNKGTLNTK